MGKAVKALKGYACLFPKVSPAHCGSVWKKASEGRTPVYLIHADSVEAMLEQITKAIYDNCKIFESEILKAECHKDARAALAAIGIKVTKGKKL